MASSTASTSADIDAGSYETYDDMKVSCGPLLRLPSYLESEFWSQRVMLVIDAFAITHALIMNMMQIKTFKVLSTATLLPHERIAMLLYPVGALSNLLLIVRRPRDYSKERLSSTISNRVGRVVLMLLTALLSTPLDAEKLAGALPGWQPSLQGSVFNTSGLNPPVAATASLAVNRTAAAVPASWQSAGTAAGSFLAAEAAAAVVDSAAGASMAMAAGSAVAWAAASAAGVAAAHSSITMRLGWRQLAQLVKPVFGPPLVTLGYCTFMLPLRLTVPLQLVTFVISLVIFSTRACWYLSRPGLAEMAVGGCRAVSTAMFAGPSLIMGSSSSAHAAHVQSAVCSSGLSSLLMLTVFVHVVLLLVVPCVAQYAIEYIMKAQFVASRGLRLESSWGPQKGAVLVGLSVQAVLLATWVLCDFAVRGMMMQDMQCSAEGWLVAAGPGTLAAA